VQEAEGAREAIAGNSALLDMYRYFAIYRDGRYLSSVPGANRFTEQEIAVYDSSKPDFQSRYILTDAPEITVLFPHGYRNNQIVIGGIGIEKNAQLLSLPAKTLADSLFVQLSAQLYEVIEKIDWQL